MQGAFFQRRKGIAFLSAVFFLFASLWRADALASGGLFKKDEPVTVTGDRVMYDRGEETYYAEGNVVVVQGTTIMNADRATLDMRAGVATAWGGVEVIDASEGTYLKANAVTADIDKGTAVAVSGRLFFTEGNVYVFGDVIRKTGPQTFDAEKSVFTTCNCPEGESPAWSFRAGYSELEVEGFLTAWNALFYVKDVPLLYTPFFAAPAKRRRQTGFLMPTFGYSDLRGVKFDNAFFWAISDSKDATFYLDIETERGVGEGLEYRYFRTARSYGEFYLYHFGESDIDRVREFRSGVNNLSRPLSADTERWELKLSHREYLEGDVTVKANIDVVSDDEYFIDFAKDIRARSLESLESTASVNKRWERYNLTLQARVFDNLFLEDDSTVLQVLPEVIFMGESQRVFSTPLFLSLESSLINFEREEGRKGERLDVRPRLALPMKPLGWLELTPSVTPRFTAYRVDDGPDESWPARFLYEFRVDSLTTLVRHFDVSTGGFEKFRHTIRPRLLYTYIPDYDRARFPDFNAVDSIPPENSLRYSLNSTLAGRSSDGVRRDILYMDLFQTFDVREARGKSERPFSDVNGELIFTPAAWASSRLRGVYDVYDGRFEGYSVELGLNDTEGSEISTAYRFIRDTTKYLDLRAVWKTTKSVSLGFRQRYSFMDTESIERDYTLWYNQQCWSVAVNYAEKLEERVVMLTFNLYGIGEVLSTSATVSENR